jgi:glucokinase
VSGFIGIDVGGTQLRVAVADARGTLKSVIRQDTEARRGPDHVIDRIVQTIDQALAKSNQGRHGVTATGIGLPGPLNGATGMVYSPANLPGWHNVPLSKILTRRTGIKTFLEHDASLAAFGEWRRGAGKGRRHMAYVTVSTGIGAGFILQGQLYRGAGGIAGELGHIVIQPGGPLCTCGNHGCLEALASGTAIARMAREAVAGRARTSLHQLKGPGRPDARDVNQAAKQGDAVARRVLDQAGAALGIGLGTLVNLLNPELIVLGGSVMNAGSLIRTPMRASLLASSWEAARWGLRMVPPALGRDVGLIGAVEWARYNA